MGKGRFKAARQVSSCRLSAAFLFPFALAFKLGVGLGLTSDMGTAGHGISDGETLFKRTIVTDAGASEYRIDGKKVTEKEYQSKLKSVGLLVKSRNFLVFQNEVEKVAQKSPKELTELIERISGSEVWHNSLPCQVSLVALRAK